ncbi:MAG: hypothetical protein ACM3NR_02195 [Methanosarcina sp.]
MQLPEIIRVLTPKASRRVLLFIAAFMWTFAGSMLLYRGFSMGSHAAARLFFCMMAGGLFYLLLFARISTKHVKRIVNLKSDHPCIFSFFSIKSYIMMTVMITGGIMLRRSALIGQENLSLGYMIMGIPLLLSALRFYYNGFMYASTN